MLSRINKDAKYIIFIYKKTKSCYNQILKTSKCNTLFFICKVIVLATFFCTSSIEVRIDSVFSVWFILLFLLQYIIAKLICSSASTLLSNCQRQEQTARWVVNLDQSELAPLFLRPDCLRLLCPFEAWLYH